jgi:TetR/AcrR family transcriptional regulator
MATKTLRQKRDQTTQRILKAATSIFSEVGFAGARVDEIAKCAGVNKATIYYHIGDKQALYAQVIHTLFEDAADRFERNVGKAQSPVEKLKFYIQTVADAMERHPELAAIMLWEQAAGGRNFPEMVAHSLARILTVISAILREGTDKGVFIETEPFIVHMMIIGTTVFCKMSAPIRAKSASLAGIHQLVTPALDINTANEIETLVLNAVIRK